MDQQVGGELAGLVHQVLVLEGGLHEGLLSHKACRKREGSPRGHGDHVLVANFPERVPEGLGYVLYHWLVVQHCQIELFEVLHRVYKVLLEVGCPYLAVLDVPAKG